MSDLSALALNPGHDGAIACIADGELVYSLEGEKDSYTRNGPVTASLLIQGLQESPTFPDVLAVGGWHKPLPGLLQPIGAGYRGLAAGELREQSVLGKRTLVYSSSHERSHLYGSVAMSPFDAESELAILVWEGVIGAFYKWRGPANPIERHEVLDQPGARYSALYCLADPTFADSGEWPPSEVAGKLMALAGYSDGDLSEDSKNVVESLLRIRSLYPFHKGRYRRSPLHNCGVTSPEFCRAAAYLTDRLFNTYLQAAQEIFEPGLPLVITGGCGLNCDWNSRWRAAGLFSDVFVPPCANDSGSALGTAVDALVQLGASCDLSWDIYRGAPFENDIDQPHGWTHRRLDRALLTRRLEDGAVLAWVQGRCEIGPRALGNRSLLASAATAKSRTLLNEVKGREPYRPIAPVCMEADLHHWFNSDQPDPYMLYFRQVTRVHEIPAVVHADDSARVQSVTKSSNPQLFRLLQAYRRGTGQGLLCNTSLNFPGQGFINRSSELFHFCTSRGIGEVVVGDRWFSAH